MLITDGPGELRHLEEHLAHKAAIILLVDRIIGRQLAIFQIREFASQ
jgi:hypothetical protein